MLESLCNLDHNSYERKVSHNLMRLGESRLENKYSNVYSECWKGYRGHGVHHGHVIGKGCRCLGMEWNMDLIGG